MSRDHVPGELCASYVGHLITVLASDATSHPARLSLATVVPHCGAAVLLERMSAWTLDANAPWTQPP